MNNEVPFLDPNDVQQNKAIVIVSLLFGILFFLPLVACPQSQYGRFYANQGLLLFIASAVCGIIPVLGWLAEIAVFVFWIMEIAAAAQGEAKRCPIFGGIDIIK